MVISNELHADSFINTARLMFSLAVEIKQKLGITLEFVNLGGGIGIPYRPEEKVNLEYVGEGIRQAYQEIIERRRASAASPSPCRSGRAITGPYGYLVSTVLHEKKTYKDYIGLDSCMANLMRRPPRSLSPYRRDDGETLPATIPVVTGITPARTIMTNLPY